MKLTPEQLARRWPVQTFDFESTESLEAPQAALGQHRALEALELAVGVAQPGFNLFVLGAPETGRFEATLQRIRQLAAALPYLVLGEWPTPLQELPELAARLRLGRLAVKRDDLSSPLYGGNKIRKLEYLLPDALASGCDAVVTYGSVGSNHALATSVFATRLGLLSHAVLVDQPPSSVVAQKLRYLLKTGAVIHAAGSFNQTRQIFERIRDSHPGGAARVCDIPWGGSSWRGAVGFVAGAFELAQQVRDAGDPPPDFLYVSGGTLGTVIGLALSLPRPIGSPVTSQ